MAQDEQLVLAEPLDEIEYGNEEKSAEQYELVSEKCWTTFSMRNDWATIYGGGVTKTELPEMVDEELSEAAWV